MSPYCCLSEVWRAATWIVFAHTEHTVRAAAPQDSDRQQSGDITPHAVHHSLALLRMGKELPETC